MSTEVTRELLAAWPLPGSSGSKYERGQVLVVGGAASSPGAAMLAGMASLRVGAGRLTLAVGESVAAHVATAVPECATLSLAETRHRRIDGSAVSGHPEFERADAVLIGPGLDDADEAVDLLDRLVPQLGPEAVVILDAFALGILPRMHAAAALAGRLVLTPNREEAELLLGRDLDDELHGLDELADRYTAVVTCFGTVAAPGGRTWTVRGDTSGLGTSGSGDVLAGAVAGLAARGATADQAAVWGTHLHLRAGQIAGNPPGVAGYLARELADALPAAVDEAG